MLLENGVSATLTLHGHSAEEGRTLRIDGTQATLHGTFSAGKQELRLERHDVQTALGGGGEILELEDAPGMAGGGHGGGDSRLCAAFVDAVWANRIQPLEDYLESQILAFALEEARLENKVLNLPEFRSRAGF